MALRASLLTGLLVCGCRSDGLIIVQDSGAPVDRSTGLGFDIATPDPADLASPDLATAPTMWIRQFGTAAADHAKGVATDGAGNIYVTGWTEGALDGNRNEGNLDAFLVKYGANGNKIWTRQFGTPEVDTVNRVATDRMGNVYVTGDTNAHRWGTFLVKYDANGNKLWTLQFDDTFNDTFDGVATDRVGNVYVTGRNGAGGEDAFVVKYDANGRKLWTRQFGTPAWDEGSGVATDGTGNIYVTGYTEGGLDGNQNAGYDDAFLVKYDSDGNKLWTRQFGTTYSDEGYGVAIDGAGNVYVTGFTTGGLEGNQKAGREDAFVVKYDADGSELWTRQFGTPVSDIASGVATDGAGNAYVAGYISDRTEPHPEDAFVVKYDANGKKIWTRQFGTPADDEAHGVAVDGSGGIYVAGDTDGAFAGNQNASWWEWDAFLARFPAEP